MKSKQNMILYILVVALIAGGFLALWLPNRTPPDTDPEAPFEDLSDREKEKVLDALAAYWKGYPSYIQEKIFWFGEPNAGKESWPEWKKYKYGVRYYGTFGGYHIVQFSMETMLEGEHYKLINGYRFESGSPFCLFAYKNGTVTQLEEVCEKGLLGDDEIKQLQQCYERYNKEIYKIEEWKEYEKNKETVYAVYMCGAGIVVLCAGICVFCYYRKHRAKNLQQCNDR